MTRIIFLIIQVIATIVPLVSLIIIIRRQQMNRTASLLLAAGIGSFIMNLAYLQMLLSGDHMAAESMMKIQYVGNSVFYIFFVLFLTNYFNFRMNRFYRIVLTIWVIIDVIAAFMLWISKWNPLMFDRVDFAVDEKLEIMRMDMNYGIMYRIRNSALSLILFAYMLATTRRLCRVKIRSERFNTIKILATELVVLVATIVGITQHVNYEVGPISTSVCIMFLTLAIIRGKLFSVTDQGDQWMMANSNVMFVLTDSLYGFLKCNPPAATFFPELAILRRNERIPDRVFALFYEKELSENLENVVELEGRYYERKVAAIKEDDSVTGYALLLADVTSQHDLMAQLQEQKLRADAANEAKSAFLSNMSHEIRTPMNAIVGMTQILMRSELPAQEMEYLANIKNSGDALLTIINDILDFSKIESGKMEIVDEEYDPMSMLHDLAMIFLNRIGEKPVELIYDIDTALPARLYGDSLRIRQVIINIMNNAIKFTQEGSVTLEMTTKQQADQVHLFFRILDTGQGIRKEDLGKLFDSFSQVDAVKNHSKEGTGLGLAISKQLVEKMGGTIHVESEYGKGSIFSFDIVQGVVKKEPAASIKEANPEKWKVTGLLSSANEEILRRLAREYGLSYVAVKEAQEGQIDYFFTDQADNLTDTMQSLMKPGALVVLQNPMQENLQGQYDTVVNKPLYSLNFCQTINHESYVVGNEKELELFLAPKARILLVDDNEMNLKVAMGLLEPLGMQIDTARNGAKALEAIENGMYDLVLMDHMMPVMDGVEATKQLRARADEKYKTLPVIALSANAMAQAREEFKAAGMNDFVSKPIRMKDMVKVLRKWLPAELLEEALTPVPVSEEELEYPDIAQLDVKEGVSNCGSVKMYYDMLRDFAKLIDQKVNKLNQCLADGLIRDYTIEVHALKNTARMIGDMELSAAFLHAEQLGNASDVAAIQAQHQNLMARYSSLKEVLAPYAAHNENQKEVPITQIVKLLTTIKESMDAFDLDSADEAMRELESVKLPDELNERATRLSALMADVAIEDVMALADEMIRLLEA